MSSKSMENKDAYTPQEAALMVEIAYLFGSSKSELVAKDTMAVIPENVRRSYGETSIESKFDKVLK